LLLVISVNFERISVWEIGDKNRQLGRKFVLDYPLDTQTEVAGMPPRLGVSIGIHETCNPFRSTLLTFYRKSSIPEACICCVVVGAILEGLQTFCVRPSWWFPLSVFFNPSIKQAVLCSLYYSRPMSPGVYTGQILHCKIPPIFCSIRSLGLEII
jgi:hypothetical protein